jgi:hypothetical protein
MVSNMQMTEQEAKQTMKASGWSYLERTRRGHRYVYAARRVKGKREERYIAPLTDLERMTEEDIVKKLS